MTNLSDDDYKRYTTNLVAHLCFLQKASNGNMNEAMVLCIDSLIRLSVSMEISEEDFVKTFINSYKTHPEVIRFRKKDN